MFNSIKKILAYFITSEELSYIYAEDFDIDEEIFYYYYCENGFRF